MARTTKVMRDGREFTVIHLGGMRKARNQSKWYASKPIRCKRVAKHVSDIVSPKGLPTSSRMVGDDRESEVRV